MATAKWSWRNWTGGTFIQDFIRTWFPRHDKGEEKKLWPHKDLDERKNFWEKLVRHQRALISLLYRVKWRPQ